MLLYLLLRESPLTAKMVLAEALIRSRRGSRREARTTGEATAPVVHLASWVAEL
jgi:hypothetical protein